MFNLVLFGPPGSGKGTQSEYIIEKYGLTHLSTGDLLRAEKKSGSELGQKITALIDNGQLVPNEMVQQMVESFVVKNAAGKGFIFDGFPRTTEQAQWLDSMLTKINSAVTLMIALDVDDAELAKRLLCRGAQSGRADDQNPDIIANRIKVYHQQTKPVMDYYKTQNKLALINGVGELPEVFARICEQMDKK
jgi:adenylate kinase